MIYNNITELIGNTPLLKIDPSVHGLTKIDLYAKLEYYNPFGSVKDRVALGMLTPILEDVKKNNKTIVEASSGNTAKALSALCGIYGIPFKTVTNRIKMPEVRMILQTLGADIEELPGLSDCPDPNDPNDFTTVAANLAKQHPDLYHYTDQYFNEENRETHYRTTGKEISDDLDNIDYFFGFLGTCGSSMGAGQYLKDHKKTKVVGIVADAGHHVPGGRNINELWEVGFFEKDFFEEIISGTSNLAIEYMLMLNRKTGILCGPTTGLTYASTVSYLKKLEEHIPDGERQTAVFIACDRLEPYMSYVQRYVPELYTRKTTNKETVYSVSEEAIAAVHIISSQELLLLDDVLIIDIRSRFAYSIGAIPNSINIMDELFAQIIEEANAFPRSKKIVIVCRIGDISKKYAAFLSNQGYDASSLYGGIMDWKAQGLELDVQLNKINESISL
jgi:cysteine synthase B